MSANLKWIRNCWLVLLFMANAAPGFAQINESDSASFQISTGASLYGQTGNVNFLSLRGRLELLLNGDKRLVFKSQNLSLYQAFGGFVADNDLLSRNFLYLNPRKRLYPFAIAFVQTNFRRNINLRYFGGVGLTYQLVQKPHSNLKISFSGVFEETLFEATTFNEMAYNGDNSISLFRATAYLQGWHTLSNKRLILTYSAYAQPSLDGIANTRLQANIALMIKLIKGLSVTLQYRYQFEQVVAEGILQADGIQTIGLNYTFRQ